jgi:zinc transport system ATP-binding protein
VHVSEVVRVVEGGVVLGGRPVLRGIDLTVTAGEVVAVLGGNGSGKTTLVRAVLGLVPLHRGAAELFGTRLEHFRQWRRVGYVPQRITATAGVPASVWEVVASGRLSHRGPLRPMRREDKVAVSEAIDAVGLGDRRHDGCATLSGGQQQRVLIAQGLAQHGDVLMLDEPVTGLDMVSRGAILDVVRAERDAGTAIVMTTHDLRDARTADHVVLLAGRVVASGPPEAVLTTDNLSAAYGRQPVMIGDALHVDDPHHRH